MSDEMCPGCGADWETVVDHTDFWRCGTYRRLARINRSVGCLEAELAAHDTQLAAVAEERDRLRVALEKIETDINTLLVWVEKRQWDAEAGHDLLHLMLQAVQAALGKEQEDTHADYRVARGCAPRSPDAPRAEEAIRRGRGDTSDPPLSRTENGGLERSR